MSVIRKINCILLLLFISVNNLSAIKINDHKSISSFDVRHREQIEGFVQTKIREILIGDDRVCQIFREYLLGTELVEIEEKFHAYLDDTELEELVKQYGWLIKMLDSWGKIPSGIFEGNINDLGNFDECLAVNGSLENVSIKGKYCLKGIEVLGAYSIGICIPSQCDLPTPNFCQDIDTGSEFTTGDIIVISIFSAVLFLMVVSTLLDCYLHFTDKKILPVLIAFSVLTNTKKLFTTNSNSSGQISCLNGIRTISLMWIIAGHAFAIKMVYPLTNFISAISFSFDKKSGYIQAGHFSVDTFFFLSAFLLSYNYLKNVGKAIAKAEKTSTKPVNPLSLNHVPMFYIHRILRILPPLAAVYGLSNTIISHFTSGPMSPYMKTIMPNKCFEYWWSFFLFVQNYVNYENMCILTTWYLSADMQMFLASPLIIIPLGELFLRNKKKLGYIFMGVVFVLCLVCPMIADLAIEQKSIENEYSTHPRLAIYTLGIIFGMVINDCINKKIKINYIVNITVWLLSLGVMLTIVLTNMDATILNEERTTKILFFTFARPAWGLALCWVIFACQFGYGGPVEWLLSQPIHQIMTRLSFSMYLLHALVQGVYLNHTRTAIHFSEYESMYLWSGDYIFTIFFSIIWVLAFESPIVVLEKFIFGGGKKTEAQQNNAIEIQKNNAQQA